MQRPLHQLQKALVLAGAMLLAGGLAWQVSSPQGDSGGSRKSGGQARSVPARPVVDAAAHAPGSPAVEHGLEPAAGVASASGSPVRAAGRFTDPLLGIVRSARPFGHPVLAEGWRPSLRPARPGKVVRVSLVQLDGFKYRMLRVEEEYPAGSVGVGEPENIMVSVADHVLVKRDPAASDEDFGNRMLAEGWKIRRRLPVSGLYLVDLQQLSPEAVPLALERLHAAPGVVLEAQADFLVTGAAAPNDPDFNRAWGLANDGQTNGTPGADIRARQAWDVQRGNREVLVGVIDTGVDYTHPDLADNIWANPGETGGGKETNGIDDDGNGLIDDWRGWDFANDDNDPMDDHFHGTHCAGTIGAVGDNGVGLSGVCWRVSIVPIKLLKPVVNASGRVTGEATVAPLSDALDAIAYSRVIGVAVTSNSWGGADECREHGLPAVVALRD
ncbi:MAG: S8 family serine peptidase [Verrucomicrobia bacterium]|nr:S8 family serine peptidase [Verrucomicrobiota bacterium]